VAREKIAKQKRFEQQIEKEPILKPIASCKQRRPLRDKSKLDGETLVFAFIVCRVCHFIRHKK